MSRAKQGKTEEEMYRSRRRGVRGPWILLVLLLILADIVAIGYKILEHRFRTRFMDGTTVNGRDISGMTAEAVKRQLTQEIDDYTLLITERTGDGGTANEAIGAAEIGLELVFDDSLEQALAEQGEHWLARMGGQTALTMDTLVQYDQTAWQMKLNALQCFNDSFIQKPVNAGISDYESGIGYQMVPEQPGNQPVMEVIRPALTEAILGLRPEINLAEIAGAYREPEITTEDAALKAKLEKMNRYANMKITYQFGDQQEVLDGDRIHRWIVTDSSGNVTLDTSEVEDFVVSLRKRYDTIFRTHTFHTTYGEEITLEGGDYGWWMNYTQEIEELSAQLKAGISGERRPVYYQTAASYGDYDYGDTYVEVNITAQHMFFYQDGIKVLESDFVSGNVTKGNDTPDGVYGITYKERNATLEGENYSSPVTWWMPFNENIGLHDAPWRAKFGSNIYKSSGSHGCVNLPYSVAKELYSMVKAGTPVIVYHLEGTESDSVTRQGEEELIQAAIDAIDYIGTVERTEECEKRIKRARELYSDLSKSNRKSVTNADVLKEAEAAYKKLK